MESFDTLTTAITALKAQGYSIDFNLEKDHIVCTEAKHKLKCHEFEIDKSFRFDVDEDPSDQAVLYAISSKDHQLKGLLVNGVGIYSDSLTNDMLDKLK